MHRKIALIFLLVMLLVPFAPSPAQADATVRVCSPGDSCPWPADELEILVWGPGYACWFGKYIGVCVYW
jgi:hypothetical protein